MQTEPTSEAIELLTDAEFNHEVFFDSMYEREGFTYAARPATRLQQTAARIPLPAKALDLGCGDGRAALYLAQRGMAVTAVDLSKVGLKKLRRMAVERQVADRITIIRQHVGCLDSLDESFDLISASTILDHLTPAHIPSAFEHWVSLLRPGGWIHVLVHLHDDPGNAGSDQHSSESAAAVRHYFESNELQRLAGQSCIVDDYVEYLEKDTSHGAVHYHSFAELVARKPRP